MLVTIDIKDGAFDKVMYLLNNLKDDVVIVEKEFFSQKLAKKKKKALKDFEDKKTVKWNDLKKEIL